MTDYILGGVLSIKIPWLLYNVETLFLSVVTYNEEKEEKAREEKKQRQLEAVELARKLEEEKKNNGIYILFTFL